MTKANKKQRVARIIEGMNSPDGWIPAASSSPGSHETAAVPESAIEPEPQMMPEGLPDCRCGDESEEHTAQGKCRQATYDPRVKRWVDCECPGYAASSAIEVAPQKGLTKGRAEVIEEMVPQWEAAMDDIVHALTKCAAHFCQHERREHQDSCGCLHPGCECDTFIAPSVAPGEAQRERTVKDKFNDYLVALKTSYPDLPLVVAVAKEVRDLCAVPSEVAPSREARLKEVVEAFDPFRRIFAINEQLKPADDTPFIRFVAGVWPTWGDFKRLVKAFALLEAK